MRVQPDDKSPTAHGKTLKSGYGFNEYVNSSVSTNQSSAVTGAQNAVTYFPEFQYKKYWRLLERMSGGYHSEFEFKKNQYVHLSGGHISLRYGCQMANIHPIHG